MNQKVFIELLFWIALGVLDLVLKFKAKDTISKRAEKLMPRGVDVAIIVGLLVVVWWLCGPGAFVVALRYTMIGHLLLGHETYKST